MLNVAAIQARLTVLLVSHVFPPLFSLTYSAVYVPTQVSLTIVSETQTIKVLPTHPAPVGSTDLTLVVWNCPETLHLV